MKPVAKSAEAFRTISEVSDELDVPKHVLRFWELKFAQIKPMKRGGGRRYYRPQDLELLRGIHHLLHSAGYTIRGVQKILREQGIDAVKQHVRGQAVVAPSDAAVTSSKISVRSGPSGLTKPVINTQRRSPDRALAFQSLLKELEYCLALATGKIAPSGGGLPKTARR